MEKAFLWYEKSAMQGNHNAEYHLANCYDSGIGVKKSYANAAKWMEKAATSGDAAAQCKLAVYYQIGQGVSRNDEAAYEWFKKASEKNPPVDGDYGTAFAKLALADCLMSGKGVDKDEKKAIAIYNEFVKQKKCNFNTDE